VITGVIGLLPQPWRLVADAGIYIDTLLVQGEEDGGEGAQLVGPGRRDASTRNTSTVPSTKTRRAMVPCCSSYETSAHSALTLPFRAPACMASSAWPQAGGVAQAADRPRPEHGRDAAIDLLGEQAVERRPDDGRDDGGDP
jgi:hypothetical protein